MATVPAQPGPVPTRGLGCPPQVRQHGPTPLHLKRVPETRELRLRIRGWCAEAASLFDRALPPSKDFLAGQARQLLEREQLAVGYLGWTMVGLASAFWERHVAAVPVSRRLFLVPPLDAGDASRPWAQLRSRAESLGYQVMTTDDAARILQKLLQGSVDAVVGVASLDVLEKALDRFLSPGIPCVAVPLMSTDGGATGVDDAWVQEMLELRGSDTPPLPPSYVHLMRGAAQLLSAAELSRLCSLDHSERDGQTSPAVEVRSETDPYPLTATETIAHDFLRKGGKHSRPFITLATYDALTGAQATQANGAAIMAGWPDGVRRTALSIETFHKASLVHDDIEDDDDFRYGDPTLHRRYGAATAINVGDYLIGLGYRLVSCERTRLGADVVAEVLDCLARAHMRLAEGQGAELMWRDGGNKRLTAQDALHIYALKTSPAFEAAMAAGARLAGRGAEYDAAIHQFAHDLGIAFQILNDLKDWTNDPDNKLAAGADILGGRPTLLWALALETLSPAQADELHELLAADTPQNQDRRLARARELYQVANVFHQADQLVEKHRLRAEQLARQIEPDPLRRLLLFLIDRVLERPHEPATDASDENGMGHHVRHES